MTERCTLDPSSENDERPAQLQHQAPAAARASLGDAIAERTSLASMKLLLPFSMTVAAFGISFGTLAVEAGLSPALATTMSATMFAGGAQFAAIAILLQGGSVAIAVTAACLLNMRFIPMALAISPYLHGNWLWRLLHAHLVIDETWALSQSSEGSYLPLVLRRAGGTLWVTWVGATLGGALLQDSIDMNRYGLDAALPALFLGLLVPRLKTKTHLAVAVGAGAVTLLLVPALPPGVPILLGGSVALFGVKKQGAS